MKLLAILALLGVAAAKPSLVTYSQDGRSFSYSYHTSPLVQTLIPAARYVQPIAPAVVVGPSVKYAYEPTPIAVNNAPPANIQLSSDGFVLDTPEVASARAEHLAAVEKEKSRNGDSLEAEPIVVPENDAVEISAEPAGTSNENFEPANIQVSSDGHVLDTPEVARARADHLARFAQEAARVSHAGFRFVHPGFFSYNLVQPVADIRVSPDGHVLDTPEVALAKAQHFALYASEAARAQAAGPGDDDGQSQQNQDDAVSVEAVAPSFPKVEDPPADIKLSADGFVLDTPEVARAKAAHLEELSKVGATEDDLSDTDTNVIHPTVPSYVAYVSPSVAYVQPKWYGPEADIKVGPDGFLLDTPEVQQARAEHLATRASMMAGEGLRYASGQAQQQVTDTPEVAAARAAHLEAHAKEAAKAPAGESLSYGQLVYNNPVFRTVIPSFGYSIAPHPYGLLRFRYAPTAAPVALTPDGQYLLDTPEVTAEKLKHFAAHAKARGL